MQHRALSGVGSLLGKDAAFDLAESKSHDGLVCDRDGALSTREEPSAD